MKKKTKKQLVYSPEQKHILFVDMSRNVTSPQGGFLLVTLCNLVVKLCRIIIFE